MLYVGFIYENYEANTLDNIIEDLELYRELSGGTEMGVLATVGCRIRFSLFLDSHRS